MALQRPAVRQLAAALHSPIHMVALLFFIPSHNNRKPASETRRVPTSSVVPDELCAPLYVNF